MSSAVAQIISTIAARKRMSPVELRHGVTVLAQVVAWFAVSVLFGKKSYAGQQQIVSDALEYRGDLLMLMRALILVPMLLLLLLGSAYRKLHAVPEIPGMSDPSSALAILKNTTSKQELSKVHALALHIVKMLLLRTRLTHSWGNTRTYDQKKRLIQVMYKEYLREWCELERRAARAVPGSIRNDLAMLKYGIEHMERTRRNLLNSEMLALYSTLADGIVLAHSLKGPV